MYNGWLEYAGIEIINIARTRKYVETYLPALSIVCNTTGLQAARAQANYVSPAADNAPWYRSSRAATGRFYGLFPGEVLGADDSSRVVSVIELSGDGATHAKPRYGSREIKFTALALAADEEAMSVDRHFGCTVAGFGQVEFDAAHHGDRCVLGWHHPVALAVGSRHDRHRHRRRPAAADPRRHRRR